MTPMTVRGVPRSLQNDAWWMAADAQTGVGRGRTTSAPRPIWLLIGLIVAFDILLMQVAAGLGYAMLVLTLAGAAHWTARAQVPARRAAMAWAVLVVALIPAIDLLQITSLVISWVGLTVFAAMIASDNWRWIVAKLPFVGILQTFDDATHPQIGTPQKADIADWILPVGVGAIFAALFIMANPLLAYFTSGLNAPDMPRVERVIGWCIAAVVIWPLLRLTSLEFVQVKRKPRVGVQKVTLVNRRSVARALVVFNALFALQTVLDLGYLWGGASLPDGMTYAQYAHRGAYPLMVTALMAGAFALIAQPWLDGKVLRGLLLVWIAQTMLLVMSSILRLDLYVDSYSLTHLRFAAFVWMIVVALGLVVLMLQIIGRKPAAWMLTRALAIGVAAVYLTSMINVSGYVATQQLTTGPLDTSYVCGLNEGAVPAIRQHKPDLCWNHITEPRLSVPDDWREWGFRNARLRRSLATLNQEVTQ